MNYLHYELELTPGDVVEVTLDKQANVRLLDEMNFSNYKRGSVTPTSGVSRRSLPSASPLLIRGIGIW